MELLDKKNTHLLESYKNIQSQIKFIDQKAGAYLLICGWMFTSYIQILKDSPICIMRIVILVVSIINLTLLLYITYTIIINIISPRIAKNETIGKSTFYYHSIIVNKAQFLKNANNLNPKKITLELSNQLSEIAYILERKTKYLKRASKYLLISIIILVLTISTPTIISIITFIHNKTLT